MEPLRLDTRIPERGFGPDGGDPLDTFLGWAADQGLSLYPHQEEAILELFGNSHVVLDTPTGSGKSLVATALHFKTFAALGRAWYTAPIKALVSEKFFELCRVFGAENVGLMTGDGSVNRDAPIVCCTAEILANLALREAAARAAGETTPETRVTSVVMDEFHYYGDRDRGMAWQVPLLALPDAQFLLLSATLGDTTAIREDLERRSGRPVVEVKGVHRPVPLRYEYSMKPEHEQLAELVKGGRAPVYVVHFTQNSATEQAQALMSTDWCSKEEKRAIADAISGTHFHSPFGPTLRRYVLHGVGLHHAGLLPRYRTLVEKLAQRGLLKVICGTDTLGVGINVPIRTVMFTQLCKFDGEKTVILPVREFRQISGRAGRAGYDDVGYVVVQAPAHVVENARVKAGDGKKKKVVKAQPPTKGYKHWDEVIFQQLVDRPPEALESRFSVDHGRLMTMLTRSVEITGDAEPGYRALLALIAESHEPAARKIELATTAETLTGHLELAGLLHRPGENEVGPWTLAEGLQHDFSLHHSLSLYLLAALQTVDRSHPDHALQIVSHVESILEHPRIVLMRQVDRAKSEKIAELKAAGVPYEERLEALEDITWPKPGANEMYMFFEVYRSLHPWMESEAVRPKSIAREMVETFAGFGEYVKTLELQRAEGVLLRYLSQFYGALVRNVPSESRTEELLDVIAFFRSMLGAVDASLLAEWEGLVEGAPVTGATDPPKIDISADSRLFKARIRAELHAVVRALSLRDFEGALERLHPDSDVTHEALGEALLPFFAEFGEIAFDRRARVASNTLVTPTGPHRWEVKQLLLPIEVVQVETYDVEGHTDEEPDLGTYELRGTVDLSADTNPEGPLVRLYFVGA